MPAGATILSVDDERYPHRFLAMVLEPRGHRLVTAFSCEEAARRLKEEAVDLILLDLRLPDGDGLDWLATALTPLAPESRPEVVVMTAHGSIAQAVRAIQLGAADFLEKPFTAPEALEIVVDRVLAQRALRAENRRLRAIVDGRSRIIGVSEAMCRLLEAVDRVADLPVTVLLGGESGSGKEVIARALHDRSSRRGSPFVALNCASIPEALLQSALFGHHRGAFTGATAERKGYFEEAGDGTLFLDEIGDMPTALQASLLRVLEEGRVTPVGGAREREVRCRVVAATHVDLRAAVARGDFREDLFYRLAVLELRVPPLRERAEDIPALAQRFVEEAARAFGVGPRRLSPELVTALTRRPWPGNVRELRNTIQRIVALSQGEVLGREDWERAAAVGQVGAGEALAAPAAGEEAVDLPLAEARERFERRYLERLLAEEAGNVTRASERAGVSRQHLHRLITTLGISAELTRGRG